MPFQQGTNRYKLWLIYIINPNSISEISLIYEKRYKESLSKSTRGWKERLFNKSPPSMSNMGSEVRREVNEGIANIIERLEVHDNNREDHNGVERIN